MELQSNMSERGLSMAVEFEIYYILFIVVAPFLIFSLIWSIFGLSYPFVFVWGMIASGKNIDNMVEDVNRRESETRKLRGKDPLSTIDGGYRDNVSDSGLVYASGVFGPSHWHLLIGWFNNLFGGSITIFQKVISTGRAEVMQRLREKAISAGWDDVINVRIDTADMTPQSSKKGVKGVEVFAYGTGIKYSD